MNWNILIFINFHLPAGHNHNGYWIEIYWFYQFSISSWWQSSTQSSGSLSSSSSSSILVSPSIKFLWTTVNFFYVLGGSLLLFWDIINLCSNNFSCFRKNNVAHFSFSLLATLLCHVYYQEEGEKCFFFVSLITTINNEE